MPTAPTTVQEVERLQRGCETLLRELVLAMERALRGFDDPAPAAAPFRTRLAGLRRDADRVGALTPPLRPGLKQLVDETERQLEAVVARAVHAHAIRGKVDGRLAQQYNDVVGQALADLPKQGTDALRGQVQSGVAALLDQAFPQGKVPGDVRQQLARELTGWIVAQPQVEDAFFVVQRVVSDVAGFLHDRLTIHGELVTLRQEVARRDALSPQDAAQADQRAGQLGARAVQLDERITRQVQQTALSIGAVVRLNPSLVLDPAKRFLARLDAQAGIKITQGDVKVELGTRIRITDPLLFDQRTGLQVQPYLGVDVGKNFQLGATYQNSLQGGRWSGPEVKVQLTWRF